MATASIAWKNLVRERTRLAISVGGVAFAVVLILLIRGLYVGFTTQATAYVRSVNADIWVANAGTPGDFFHSVSLQRPDVGTQLATIPGVARVTPFVGRPVVFSHDGRDVDLYLVGVDSANPIAAPNTDRSGQSPRAGEIIVDRVFARNNNIEPGDVLRIQGVDLRVSDVASGGNAIVSQFAWANLRDVDRILGQGGLINYFLINTGPGAEPAAVTQSIQTAVPATKSMTKAHFAELNTQDIAEGVLPIIWVLVLIGFVIGTLVIGLTIYTATLEKRREYGVLKAIGFSNRALYGIVWRQSLASAVLGLAVGIALTLGLGVLLEQLLPAFVTSFSARDIGLVGIAALAMAVVSSFVPIRPVARLDPAQVFRV
ncbi:ABC transporter permease [Mycobacterium hubeiense]|uniref:ABC transporter permease n=1 Tax=Mycobacterium hubeiense TaxID=1867256 RepID=UPI000C7EFE95|nr:ABC transporter permease [Mycobacterium sp. QGD 101]